jgi:hypothetical protein
MKFNNYRLFHDRASSRMVFMPHGLDQVFGIGDQPDLHIPILPHMGGLVSGAVVSTREGRARYLARFAELRTNVFNPEAVIQRVRELEQRLRPALEEIDSGLAAQHSRFVERLCRNIATRAASIDDQLANPPEALDFSAPGGARIAGWRPRHGVGEAGKMQTDGRNAIRIQGNGDAYASSWRTRVAVPQGRYRFEGEVKTRGADRNGDSGATLRISGAQRRPALKGDAEWTRISFPFEVHEPFQQVELICEFRSGRGEAWFDTASLKIRKVN